MRNLTIGSLAVLLLATACKGDDTTGTDTSTSTSGDGDGDGDGTPGDGDGDGTPGDGDGDGDGTPGDGDGDGDGDGTPGDGDGDGTPGDGDGDGSGCIESGGVLTQLSCCLAVESFPDTCLTGACGCAPNDSHMVVACECPQGTCYDATMQACVPG
jgi:hypothetical protein